MMLAIFLGLLVYLKSAVFEPYLTLRDARDERTDNARKSAREMQVRAEELLASYETQLTGARVSAAASRTELLTASKDQEQEILTAARREVSHIVSQSRDGLDKELEKARADLTREAEALSALIVERVLG